MNINCISVLYTYTFFLIQSKSNLYDPIEFPFPFMPIKEEDPPPAEGEDRPPSFPAM
jgi:hypothetical protein